MTVTRTEAAALRLLTVRVRTAVEVVKAAGSKAATERLLAKGLIARSQQWAGCFRLTEKGATFVAQGMDLTWPAPTR